MTLAKIILTIIGEGLLFVDIADEAQSTTQHISSESMLKLQNSKGKTIVIRHEYEHNHPKKYKARAAMVGSYDGKGTLNIAVGEVGMPINSDADIVLKETYQIDPKLFDAFCAVFKATIQDTEAVKGIATKARKSQVVEVDIKF